MNTAQKSVSVRGNLNDGPIRYTCYPINEFSENKWLIAIASVTFDSTETISTTCSLSCNFVTSRKRSTKGEIEVYEQPLNTFHMKTSAQASRGIFRFCKY